MSIFFTDEGRRADVLKGVKRVVVKVGTQLLMGVKGVSKGQRVEELVAQIAALRARGLEVILVTSGAIGAGMRILATPKRPADIPGLQAHAAVGQCRLMYLYESACASRGFHCGQLLLTAADLREHNRNLNVSNCLNEMLRMGVLPVINENDSVSVDEIKFGDNDTLAALVGSLCGADLVILLTTIDGMHEKTEAGFGRRFSVVEKVTTKLKQMAGGTDGNSFSVGGMITKVRAAEMVMKSGAALWITEGKDFGALARVFAGADEGTLFAGADGAHLNAHKRFLAFFSKPAGDLTVDAGAAAAVVGKGKSLLPSGIREVAGSFRRGATVRVLGPDGREIAKGVTNYDSAEIQKIRGHSTADLPALLGGADGCYEEVIHRNHLVLTETTAD